MPVNPASKRYAESFTAALAPSADTSIVWNNVPAKNFMIGPVIFFNTSVPLANTANTFTPTNANNKITNNHIPHDHPAKYPKIPAGTAAAVVTSPGDLVVAVLAELRCVEVRGWLLRGGVRKSMTDPAGAAETGVDLRLDRRGVAGGGGGAAGADMNTDSKTLGFFFASAGGGASAAAADSGRPGMSVPKIPSPFFSSTVLPKMLFLPSID